MITTNIIMQIILFVAVISTGLMAGIFFTWSNAVTPGIGKLDDKVYLSSLQSMNRVILNPLFYVAFITPIIATLVAPMMFFKSENIILFKLLSTSAVLYFVGVFLVTVLGNIPLNNALHRFNIETASINESNLFRTSIESKWNSFNLIRSITSIISFVLLLITCVVFQR